MYELIQNAEDNTYARAASQGQEPFFRFEISPGKIIIESNEDGFQSENVKAICSIGESTKRDRQGYIGEKGIGFKSIFKVAKKVHIQSGPFSFSFSYTRSADEDGLGMVTPYEHPYVILPSDVTTRFTLTPKDDYRFDRQVADIESLPKTCLLFLARIRKITIAVSRPSLPSTVTTYSTSRQAASPLETIVATTRHGNSETEALHRFQVKRRAIDNLPEDENRPDTRNVEVVLAFPVDRNDNPITSHQYTYAYLPLRNLGFTVRETHG